MHPYATDENSREWVPVALAVFAVAVAAGFAAIARTCGWNPPFWVETPSVMGVYGLAHVLFNQLLWKPKIIGAAPNLSGTWEGAVHSSHDVAAPVPVTVRIEQTWTRIGIHLEAPGSTSRSSIAGFENTNTAHPTLTYEYLNEPKAHQVRSMVIHRGTVSLRLTQGADEDVLDGEYYTGRGRKNHGSLRLVRRRRSKSA